MAEGDLSQELPVQSTDEVGVLTRAFNGMVEGLRQRDFIRNTFGRYVSPEVVKTLLESPEGLRFGGEKRVVTILMSDLRGYTRFAEQGDPAGVMAVLNDYLGRMADIVIAHGGTINEFIGDAVFAVFGAPLPHPDHAERAAASALAMQRAMVDINRRYVERGRPRFEMGIGVNTGEAVVGNIGSEERLSYTVIGDAVNLASRLEGLNKLYGTEIMIGEATRAAVGNRVLVRELDRVAVYGRTGSTGVYELIALAEQRGDPLLLMTFAYHIPSNYTDEAFKAKTLDYASHHDPLRLWGTADNMPRAIDATAPFLADGEPHPRRDLFGAQEIFMGGILETAAIKRDNNFSASHGGSGLVGDGAADIAGVLS